MAKAQEELEKLVKKASDKEMSPEQKEAIKKQLDDLKNKLERLAEQKEKKEQLEQMNREGKIDAETLRRELDRIDKENAKLRDLTDLASKLGQMKQALDQNDADARQKAMKQAADALKDMDLSQKEVDDLNEQMQRLQDAKSAAGRSSRDDKGAKDDGSGPGRKNKGRDGDEDGGKKKDGGPDKGDGGDGNQPGNQGNGGGDSDQPNDGGTGSGKRPLGKDKPFNSYEARQKTPFDPKGQKLFDGWTPGQSYKAKAGPELMGDIRQATQDAPEAIEQQRIPRSARDMAKGYFENLGAQGTGPKAPPAPPK
jgi:hypothetical protein